MRQFHLAGAAVAGQSDVYSGEYRETIWGYGTRPLTVIGTFTLYQGAAEDVVVDQRIYLPLLMKQ
jgi:hypothetical protein